MPHAHTARIDHYYAIGKVGSREATQAGHDQLYAQGRRHLAWKPRDNNTRMWRRVTHNATLAFVEGDDGTPFMLCVGEDDGIGLSL